MGGAPDILMGPGEPAGDRREIVGWLMYDWANSAFQTTVLTVLIGPYLTALAQQAAGENGVVMTLGPLGAVTAKSFFPYCITVSVFLQVCMLPLLGAAADYGRLKKPLMMAFCYIGATATCLMFFVDANTYIAGGMLLIVANVCFGATLVIYNAFLNDVAPLPLRNAISSRGFALGYLGGGVLLALNLALLLSAGTLGIPRGLAVRLSLLSAGLWWGGFAMITFARLKSRGPASSRVEGRSDRLAAGMTAAGAVLKRLGGAFAELARLPHTLRYLAGYMLFNDGIQTVIAISSVFLAQELFVSRGLPADESFLIGLILMVQFVAFGGALLFERIARVAGTKNAIMLSLVIWTGIVIYAYGLLENTTQAWVMGALIAVVLGGSQALSRSLFSQMIPPGREASFFGLYEISERGTSWIGPLIFGIVVGRTNSYRQAILSLIILFVAGFAVLASTDTDRAIRDASA